MSKAGSATNSLAMDDLPKEREKVKVFPFKNTGVDFFGPFEVIVMRRQVELRYCSSIPLVRGAFHIEVVNGMDSDGEH